MFFSFQTNFLAKTYKTRQICRGYRIYLTRLITPHTAFWVDRDRVYNVPVVLDLRGIGVDYVHHSQISTMSKGTLKKIFTYFYGPVKNFNFSRRTVYFIYCIFMHIYLRKPKMAIIYFQNRAE